MSTSRTNQREPRSTHVRYRVTRTSPIMGEEIQAMLRKMMRRQETRLMEKFQGMLEDQSAKILSSVEKMIKEKFEKRKGESEGGSPKEESASSDEVGSIMEAISYGEFIERQPSTFSGSTRQRTVAEWVSEIEEVFSSIRCKEKYKVKFAVTRLRLKALKWWEFLEGDGSVSLLNWVTWSEFIELIKGEFCTIPEPQQTEMDCAKRIEETTPVEDYNSSFLKLQSVSKGKAPNQESVVHRYVEGLPNQYRASIGEPATLKQAMERALKVEEGFKRSKGKGASQMRNFRDKEA